MAFYKGIVLLWCYQCILVSFFGLGTYIVMLWRCIKVGRYVFRVNPSY